jgi:hypothetical protein
VDPSLHRNRVGWDELDVPSRIRDMSEELWRELQPLADPGGDTPAVHRALDEAHAAYAALYTEAEDIAQSSVTAAKPRRRPAAPERAGAGAAGARQSLRVRLARRVPARYRRRIRSAVHSLRGSG